MAEDVERIVPLQVGGSLPPLFCIHAVSGSAYSYAGLARRLGQDRPVYGFEAPGFDNDRTPVSSLPALAEEYTAILREFCRDEFDLDAGYHLLGWSLGGSIAFEMAKRLVSAGSSVDRLVLVDAGLPAISPLPPHLAILRRYLGDLMGRTEASTPELDELLRDQPADASAPAIFELALAAGLLPEEFDIDLVADQYAVFHALLSAFYDFEPTGSFAGRSGHLIAAESPAADMNWAGVLPGLNEKFIPGSHYSMWNGDNLHHLADAVAEFLRTESRNLVG